MTNGISAFGTLLKMGDGATTEVFTTIAEVIDIKGPKLKLNTDDGTNHSSPNGWEEDIPTTLTAGEVSFKVNWDPANATHRAGSTGLAYALVNRLKKNFQLVLPNSGNTTWAFAAHVTAFEPDMPTKGKLSADITLKITGQPTLA